MIKVWQREFERFGSTPRLWWLVVFIPPLVALTLGLIFSERTPHGLPVVLVDFDQTPQSRQLQRAFDSTSGVALVSGEPDLGKAATRVRQGQAHAVLVIPTGFARELIRGDQPRIQIYTNRQASTSGNVVLSNVTMATVTAGFEAGLARGILPAALVDARALFNPGLDFSRFLALPLTVAVLHVLMVVVAIDVTGRELRERTADQWLASADGQAGQALVAKLLPYFAWFCLYGGLILWLMVRAMSVEIAGSAGYWLLGWACLVAACFGLGVFLMALLSNLRLATSVASILVSPAFAYSGMTFPNFAMSGFAAFWSTVLPLHHFLHFQTGQLAMGASIQAGAWHLLSLLLVALLPLLAWGRWQRLLSDPAQWGKA
ncbi:MAG: ABC transporter permease [Wenzhouxiangellaceae bacterium]|nr:ABC transporter permease [Wenzhouxiangellaceae bacterium]